MACTSHTPSAASGTETPRPDYLAGLLDGQFGVTLRKDLLRVFLANTDDRISAVVRETFLPTKETIVKTVKKTTCVMDFVGDEAKQVLKFMKRHSKTHSALAACALGYLSGEVDRETLEAAAAKPANVPGEITDAWMAGFFDAKGAVDLPSKESKKRGAVRVITSKAYPDDILEIMKTSTGSGKVKKARLVFDTKAAMTAFVDHCGGHIKVKDELLRVV